MTTSTGADLTSARTTVVSFNVWWDPPEDQGAEDWALRRAGVVEAMLNLRPDLIGTQETMRNQVEDLDASLEGYTRVSRRTQPSVDYDDTALWFREERYRLVCEDQFWLSTTPDVPYTDDFPREKSFAGYGPRMVSCAYLLDELDGDAPLVFCNTHWDGDPLVNEGSAAAIFERLKDAGAPIIFTGDFNHLPYRYDDYPVEPSWARDFRSRAYEMMTSWSVDVHDVLHPDSHDNTGCGLGPCEDFGIDTRIDWILATPELVPISSEVIYFDGTAPSDHRPVVAVLER